METIDTYSENNQCKTSNQFLKEEDNSENPYKKQQKSDFSCGKLIMQLPIIY